MSNLYGSMTLLNISLDFPDLVPALSTSIKSAAVINLVLIPHCVAA